MVEQNLLWLLQAALTNRQIDNKVFAKMSESEWDSMLELSAQHGVSTVIFSEIVKLKELMPVFTFRQWIFIDEHAKMNYDRQSVGVQRMARMCKRTGNDLLVIKGLTLSKYYPYPASRQFGDLDAFVFPHNGNPLGKECADIHEKEFHDAHKRITDLLEANGINVEYWDKHDVFNIKDVHVELHSYFVNNNSASGKRINEYLLGIVASDRGVLVAENTYHPTPDFNVVYLLNHTIAHMAYEGATLKNVLDYGMFLMKDGDNVNWEKVLPVLKETGWIVGFNTLVRVSEKVLDVDFSRFYFGDIDEPLADKVLGTILDTSLHQESSLPGLKRVYKKTQRLFSRRWMYSCGLIPANFWTDYVWWSLKEHVTSPGQI